MRTSKRSARPTTSSANSTQWKSGSGPTSKSTSRPDASIPRRSWISGHAQLGRDAVDDARHRAPGALVEEVLAVEGGDEVVESVTSSSAATAVAAPNPASIQPSKATTSDGVGERRLVDDDDVLVRTGQGSAARSSRAFCASVTTWAGNESTGPASPAVAPAA